MQRTRNQHVSHARLVSTGGSCAPLMPSVGLLRIMRFAILILSIAVLIVAATTALGQDPIVEYGPGPTYTIIGLHRLATSNRGCQMQRYSGTVVAIEGNPYLEMMTKGAVPWQTSFTLNVKGRRIAFPLAHLKGVSGDQLEVLLKKRTVLRVRALRCGPDVRVDSIELP
jgi:hypothetical protein